MQPTKIRVASGNRLTFQGSAPKLAGTSWISATATAAAPNMTAPSS